MTDARVYFEDGWDHSNSITAAGHEDGSINIGVEEEKAMDSYNRSFVCQFRLTPEQAIKLGIFLIAHAARPHTEDK